MRHRWHYIAGATPLVAVLFVLWLVWPPSPGAPGVTRQNFACIRDGMRLADVEKLFGQHADAIVEFGIGPGNVAHISASWHIQESGNDVQVWVFLDKDFRVTGMQWHDEVGLFRGFMQRLGLSK